MKIWSFISVITVLMLCVRPLSVSAQKASELAEKAAIQTKRNNHVKAFQYYVKALITALDDGDDRMAMKCAGNISIIYHDFGDTENSIYFANMGYDIARRLGDEAQTAFLSNFVSFYSQAEDSANAAKYYKLMCEMMPKSNTMTNRYFLIYERARLERMNKQFGKAIKSHAEARMFAVKNDMPDIYVLFQDSEIGNIMIAQKRWGEALSIGRECLAKAEKIPSEDMKINSFKMISDAFAGLGIKDSADSYMRKYYKLKNKIYDLQGFFKVSNGIMQYKEKKAEGKISRLNIIILASNIAILAFITLTVIITRKNISLKKAHRLLIEKNKVLQDAEAKSNKMLGKYLSMKDELERMEGKEKSAGGSSNAQECLPGGRRHDVDNMPTNEMQEKLLCRIISVLEDMTVISDPDFSLSAMAERTGSNTKYVSMVINGTYNKNFKTLLNEYRIREACRRMADADYDRFTIKAIACDVGFRNTVSFIRCFKNVMGMTPSVYQRLAKEETSSEKGSFQ